MQKNVLFISYDGMTDPLGQSQVIPYMLGLSKKGYNIFILSCEKPDAFKKNEAVVKSLLTGMNIHWIPVHYTKSPPVLSTLKDIIQLKKAAKKIHRSYGIDLVHTRPGIPALVGLWMKRTMQVRFLHDIREFYADSRVEGGIWNRSNPLFNLIYKYFKKKEGEELAQADGMVCLTNAAAIIVKKQRGFKANIPLTVIPCSTDLYLFDSSRIDNSRQEFFRKELAISDQDFIVSYLGSVGGWYLTKEMLRFCRLLLDKRPGTKFLFISPHLHEFIADAAAGFGIPRENLLVKMAKREEVPVLLSLSNYSLFFIKPCFSKLSSSPTKHGEVMAMGIPVITNSGVGDVKEIVEKYQSGFVVEDFSEASLSEVADQIVAGKTFDATNIRQGAVDVYSLDNAVNLYAQLYDSILSASSFK